MVQSVKKKFAAGETVLATWKPNGGLLISIHVLFNTKPTSADRIHVDVKSEDSAFDLRIDDQNPSGGSKTEHIQFVLPQPFVVGLKEWVEISYDNPDNREVAVIIKGHDSSTF